MIDKNVGVLKQLFDGSWYLSIHSDVKAGGTNPLEHYLLFGWQERRQPHRLFDPEWYLAQCAEEPEGDLFLDYLTEGWLKGYSPHPLFDGNRYLQRNWDAAALTVNPLLHYLTVGRYEKRSPHDLFQAAWYLDVNKDVAAAEVDPLEHYLDYGWKEGRDPHPVFNVKHYLLENKDVAEACYEPLTHYIMTGWKENRSPGPLFDTSFYLKKYPDVISSGVDPLTHYLISGAGEGKQPHPLFDTEWYTHQNPDVARSGLNPLLHFLSSGCEEGRSPHPLFDPQFYRSQLSPDIYVRNPLLHYLSRGAQEGFNPNRLFDGNWYMAQHELLRFSDVNPLVHYATEGRFEGRDAHPDFDHEWYLAVNRDVEDSGIDPLSHFLSSGAAEGRETAPPNRKSSACTVLDIPFELRYADCDFRNKDVCVLVTYARNGELSRHTFHHIRAYAIEGFKVVLVIVTEGVSAPIPDRILGVDAIIVRINHGWDFAAWSTALSILPDLWHASNLILANDSVYGPLSKESFAKVINSVRNSASDIISLTDSYQNYRHYMSYFTALKPSALRSKVVQDFWNDVRSLKDKDLVIHSYEIPALRKFEAGGLAIQILFPTLPGSMINPTLTTWRELVNAGFPFIKVQALRDDLAQVDSRGWESELGENPELLDDIRHHLHQVRNTAQDVTLLTAIPAPKRRFKRPRVAQNAIGAINAVRPCEGTDLVIKVPFDFKIASAEQKPSIAVIAHIFYPELAEEIRKYIEKIPHSTDVYVSTDTDSKKIYIEKTFASYSLGNIIVTVFPNIGRDIAPMFVGYRDVIDNYEYILHIHSKISPHNEVFSGWRKYLLDGLVGSLDLIESILSIFQNSDVGIIFPDHFPQIKNLLNWGYNFDACKNLMHRIGADLDQGLVLEFPSSSFFWARSAALRPLVDLNLEWEDFSDESGQIDGTIAHAIERSLLYIAESAGYSWTKVGTLEHTSADRLISVFGLNDIKRALVRTYRPLLSNPVRPYQYYDHLPEEKSVSARIDHSIRPRLNLVLPTLRPELVFGGINTAIKIFQEIAAEFSERVDLRILVLSTPVDMESGRNFPDYRLVQSGSPYDDFQRTIVDVCDNWSRSELPLRKNDIFVTTAWWTNVYADSLKSFQRQRFGEAPKTIYMVQDYESGFYPWSNQYCLSGETYKNLENTIALVNSEELSGFMQARYDFHEAYVIRYKPNEKIENALFEVPRERIVMFYGRPGTPRNCFQAICQGIFLWQQKNPVLAARWKIISVGEKYPERLAKPLGNLEIRGKMSLEDYGNLLSRASVGISLMVSPHPSYPPLEMALAGMKVITNSYDVKNLEKRNANIVSLSDVSANAIEKALSAMINQMEAHVGEIATRSYIRDLDCKLPNYNPRDLAQLLERSLEMKA